MCVESSCEFGCYRAGGKLSRSDSRDWANFLEGGGEEYLVCMFEVIPRECGFSHIDIAVGEGEHKSTGDAAK